MDSNLTVTLNKKNAEIERDELLQEVYSYRGKHS